MRNMYWYNQPRYQFIMWWLVYHHATSNSPIWCDEITQSCYIKPWYMMSSGRHSNHLYDTDFWTLNHATSNHLYDVIRTAKSKWHYMIWWGTPSCYMQTTYMMSSVTPSNHLYDVMRDAIMLHQTTYMMSSRTPSNHLYDVMRDSHHVTSHHLYDDDEGRHHVTSNHIYDLMRDASHVTSHHLYDVIRITIMLTSNHAMMDVMRDTIMLHQTTYVMWWGTPSCYIKPPSIWCDEGYHHVTSNHLYDVTRDTIMLHQTT